MSGSVLDLVRPDLRDLDAYAAAAPDFERLRLHANESPWPTDVDLRCEGLNRYPPVRAVDLEARLAQVYGVPRDTVLVTRGSDDGIDLLVRAFCRAGEDAVLTTPPTFGMYAVAARLQNAHHTAVPLRAEAGFALEPHAVIAACRTSVTPVRLVFLCSPNNPTGNRLDPDAVREVCAALAGQAVVVVDEAYAEFAGDGGHAPDLARFENLVVLRTMSKAHGLAGVRCGAVLAAAPLVTFLSAIAPPYSTPSPVIDAVCARLTPAALAQTRERMAQTAETRTWTAQRLAGMAGVKHVWPSAANFLLVEVDDAADLVAHCHGREVLVRHFPGKQGLENAVRISIGTPQQMRRLVDVMETWR